MAPANRSRGWTIAATVLAVVLGVMALVFMRAFDDLRNEERTRAAADCLLVNSRREALHDMVLWLAVLEDNLPDGQLRDVSDVTRLSILRLLDRERLAGCRLRPLPAEPTPMERLR